MLIYSKEFKDYWYKAKGGEIDFPYFLLGKPEWIKTFEMQSRESEIADLILPCSHKGCSFDRCDLLQEESMMSSSYKIKRLKPSFELTKKLEEEQRLSKYLEEKEVFDAAIQEIHQLVCPNCQAVQSYKVHIPSKYKRGEIICLGCGKSLFILNPF